MKRSAFLFLAILLAFPAVMDAQTYYRPYYEQRALAPLPTTPYFLENRTGAPLLVALRLKFPTGREELWFFNIEPEKEVVANIPNGGVQASIKYATASVPRGDKVETRKAVGQLYNREEKNGKIVTGWWFYKK